MNASTPDSQAVFTTQSETKSIAESETTTALAAQLYERYCTAVGGIAFNGEPLPAWATFVNDPTKTKQCAAWIMVAEYAKEWALASRPMEPLIILRNCLDSIRRESVNADIALDRLLGNGSK